MIRLPYPPSTNNLFRNRAGGRAKTEAYNAWHQHAGLVLNGQRIERTPGPVVIDITVERRRKTADIDGKLKAPIDLLVEHRVIDDDRNVAEVRARWGAVEGCEVRVLEANAA